MQEHDATTLAGRQRQRADVGATPSLRSSAVARRRLRPDAHRFAAHRHRRRERPPRRLLRGRGPGPSHLPHPPGRCRPAHEKRPAVQGRGGGPGPLGVPGSAISARRPSTPTPPRRTEPVLTEGGASAELIPNLEIEANDVRLCSHASVVLGPIDDDVQRLSTSSRGASRPRRPSSSSCSASSTPSSTGCPARASPGRYATASSASWGGSAPEARACSVDYVELGSA